MKYADTSTSDNNQQAQHLNSAYAVCTAAQLFFQQAAQLISSSNLRYQFIQLSKLHQIAARQLPVSTLTQLDYRNELAAVEFWYLHQCAALHNPVQQPLIIAQLAGLLQQQLLGLKQLTRQVTIASAKVTLAHLSAALQMAIDQISPLLKAER